MRKRTKKKIHLRIIKKLISGQPLSDFDRKYHEEMIRKVYVTKPKVRLRADKQIISTNTMERVANQMTASETLPVVKASLLAAKIKNEDEFEKEYSDLQKTTDAMRRFAFFSEDNSWPKSAYEDLLSVGRGKATPGTVRDDAVDSLRYSVLANDKPVIARHPSKWQRVKNKMKGWFGK